MSLKNGKVLGILIFAALVAIPIFWNITDCGIYQWDEARNSINALEMSEGGNPLVRTFNGEPDHWETKPPMLIWLQVLFIKIFGPETLALRLPSMLAGIFLVGSILWLCVREMGDWKAGVLSVLILLTSAGYVRPHVLRSGDHDALLLFFLTLQVIAFFMILSGLRKGSGHSAQVKWWLLMAFSLSGAVLTKSISGLFLLPGIALFTVFAGQLRAVLTSRMFYVTCVIFIAVAGAYYFGRTYFDPEYLYWVSENELYKRYLNSATEYGYNESSPWYYVDLLYRRHFSYWIWFLPFIGLALWRISGNDGRRRLIVYLMVVALVFLTIISLGTTNDWYAAPTIPLMAMALGLSLSVLSEEVIQKAGLSARKYNPFLYVAMIALIVVYPYSRIIADEIANPQPHTPDMSYGNFMATIPDRVYLNETPTVLSECYNAHVQFYLKVYPQYKGLPVGGKALCEEDIAAALGELHAGGLYILCNAEYERVLSAVWKYRVESTEGWCRLVRLEERQR